MKLDHTMSHGVAGGVGVEAAEEGQRRMEQGGEPSGVGSGAGGGQAAIGRIQGVATDGVNGRFAKDDGSGGGSTGREEAGIFAGARSQAAPGRRGGAA